MIFLHKANYPNICYVSSILEPSKNHERQTLLASFYRYMNGHWKTCSKQPSYRWTVHTYFPGTVSVCDCFPEILFVTSLFTHKYLDLDNKFYGHLIQLVSERARIWAQLSPMCFHCPRPPQNLLNQMELVEFHGTRSLYHWDWSRYSRLQSKLFRRL